MNINTLICQVTPDVLKTNLFVCVKAMRPAFVWGSPGIGKSDIVRQLASKLSAHLIDLRASQWDAVDTRGIPYLSDNKGTRWAIPEIFPSHEFAAQHQLIIIFLDELNSAPPSVQAALYQLILDRRLGDYVLPDNVQIIAAGNLETDRSVTHRMSQALADRFFHFELLVDNDAWQTWALNNDVHVACVSYVRWRPDHLHSWDAKSPSKSQATPRGWEFTSDVLKVIESEGVNGLSEQSLLAGKLGEAVSAEFLGFLKIYRNLPDPDAMLMNPDTTPISEDPAVKYALCGAIAERASQDNMDRVIKIAQRLEPEFMTLLVRAAAIRNSDVQQTHAFIKWASDNADVLI